MVPEAPLERTETGLVPSGEGWFVLNARDARWFHSEGPNASSEFEGETEFEQLGIFLRVLGPGVPMGLYHREADQEGFLVLSGQALLIVEGEERPLRQWDFFHCPPETKHTIVGAGKTPCVVLAVGAREHQRGAEWGAYTLHDVALRHGAGSRRRRAIEHERTPCFRSPKPARIGTGGFPEVPSSRPRPSAHQETRRCLSAAARVRVRSSRAGAGCRARRRRRMILAPPEGHYP